MGAAFPEFAADNIAAFQHVYRFLDEQRRVQGRILDAMGFGPRETPGRFIISHTGMRLKAYGLRTDSGTPVLIVPAPIKRAYIWDLAPGTSVVERLREAGFRPYLIHWDDPDPHQGLADYAVHHLESAVHAVQGETRGEPFFLAGHSLGGMLAAIYAARHPKKVRGAILIASPLHFTPDAGTGALGPAISRLAGDNLYRKFPGNLPGSALSAAAYAASPETFGDDRVADWAHSLADPPALATHLRVERWSLDELPIARHFVADMAKHLYGEDGFLRGTLRLAARTAGVGNLTVPLFLVADQRCLLVPPTAILPAFEAAPSRDKRLEWYEGDVGVAFQHVGPLVGRNAHGRLWPEIIAWLRGH